MKEIIFDLELWKIVNNIPKSFPEWKRFSDEPAIQRYILNNSIPLIKDQEIFYPLCTEFPYSPGVDLIYISSKKRMCAAELKRDSFSSKIGQEQELAYKFDSIKKRKISELSDYIKNRKFEANKKTYNNFRNIIDRISEKTFGDIYTQGNLYLCCIVFGKPQEDYLNKENLFDIYGLCFNKNLLKSYYIIAKNENLTERDSRRIKYAEQHKQNLAKERGRKRPKRSKKEIEESINCEEPQSPIRYIYEFFKKKDFLITPGTGKLSFFAQFNDVENRTRTILDVRKECLRIPGNLYNQAIYLSMSEEQIDNLFNKVIATIEDKAQYRITKSKNIIISLENVRLPKAKVIIDNLLDILISFTSLKIKTD